MGFGTLYPTCFHLPSHFPALTENTCSSITFVWAVSFTMVMSNCVHFVPMAGFYFFSFSVIHYIWRIFHSFYHTLLIHSLIDWLSMLILLWIVLQRTWVCRYIFYWIDFDGARGMASKEEAASPSSTCNFICSSNCVHFLCSRKSIFVKLHHRTGAYQNNQYDC